MTQARWWDEPEGAVHSALIAVVEKIRESQSWREDADAYHAELYAGGTVAAGLRPGSRSSYEYVPSQVPHNVVRQCIDARTAKIARSRPLPIVQSSAGSWSDYKRARKASQFVEGEAYRQRFFAKLWPVWIRDAQIFGSGFLCVRRHGRSVVTERVLPKELYVDEWDAQHGDPRNIYRVRDIDRGVAVAMFATKDDGKLDQDLAGRIKLAERIVNVRDLDDGTASTVDRITIVEAWHLCDDDAAHAPTAKAEEKARHAKHCTGRYVVSCSAGDLRDAEWTRGYFPFIKLDDSAPIVGYFGQGLAEQLEGYQFEINFLEDRIQEAYQLVPGLVVVTDGDILDSHLTNGVGRVIKRSRGGEFQISNPEPVHPQMFQRLESLIAYAYRDSGQTELGIAGEKPAGVESGVALREVEDQESGRHVVLARAAEEGVIEVARQWIDTVKEIAEEYGDATVSVPMRDGFVELNWKDCDVETFELRVFSASVLPQQRSARLQTLTELFSNGLVDRQTFLRQLEASDLQAEIDLETSGRVLVDEQIEAMLLTDSPDDEDEYHPPSQFVDLEWALKRAQQKHTWATLRKAPPENLNLIARYIADVERLIAEAAPPPAPAMPAVGAGDPTTPPVALAPAPAAMAPEPMVPMPFPAPTGAA